MIRLRRQRSPPSRQCRSLEPSHPTAHRRHRARSNFSVGWVIGRAEIRSRPDMRVRERWGQRLNYLSEKLGLDMAEAERNSPLRHLPAAAGELMVAYGIRELPELCRQSIEYGRAWTERGLPGRLLPIDGADHFTILEALAQPEGVLTRALMAMLGR